MAEESNYLVDMVGSTACAGKKDWWDPDVDQAEFTKIRKRLQHYVKKIGVI